MEAVALPLQYSPPSALTTAAALLECKPATIVVRLLVGRSRGLLLVLPLPRIALRVRLGRHLIQQRQLRLVRQHALGEVLAEVGGLAQHGGALLLDLVLVLRLGHALR